LQSGAKQSTPTTGAKLEVMGRQPTFGILTPSLHPFIHDSVFRKVDEGRWAVTVLLMRALTKGNRGVVARRWVPATIGDGLSSVDWQGHP
jgi:hypothetical protein